ncbi:MAG: hypothetical protein B6U72_06915 [Candidatus Altiarchaeales archaeon ex4484_2]|nr:MAG: hypothetical protein B6U72_06915 [Candidatus Altiarchaeales archaeon ex4484_2]
MNIKMTGLQQERKILDDVIRERKKESPGEMDDLMFKAVVAAIIIGLLRHHSIHLRGKML